MTQTNEAARAAVLRPAFGRAAELIDGQPMALVEIGTSAGLLLVPDRYRYRYHDGSRAEIFRRRGLTIDCEIRGDGWPTPAGTPLAIASRTGIDLNPIRLGRRGRRHLAARRRLAGAHRPRSPARRRAYRGCGRRADPHRRRCRRRSAPPSAGGGGPGICAGRVPASPCCPTCRRRAVWRSCARSTRRDENAS